MKKLLHFMGEIRAYYTKFRASSQGACRGLNLGGGRDEAFFDNSDKTLKKGQNYIKVTKLY